LDDARKHKLIDQILEKIKDREEYHLESIIKAIDSTCLPYADSVWHYMVNENLLASPSDILFYGKNDTQITHHGIKILEDGGWGKFRKRNEKPIHESRWFAFGGWLVALLVGVLSIVDFFWPGEDQATTIQKHEFFTDNPPQLVFGIQLFIPATATRC
jgi:hypothetical protein